MATYQELRTRSQQVRDEQNIGGNTALRVGQLLMDIVKYFYDNDAAASEYLQQHFAMVNDGTHLLNWQQSPIVILHTMGEAYDDGDWSALSQGENYYRAGFIMEADGQGGGVNGETPKANVLYVNLANDTLYTWNGSSFDAITSGGGGGISGDDIIKNAYYSNGNLVLIIKTENGDKTVTIPVTFDASNYVPTSRTVNGKALRGNITLSQSDIPGLVAALAAKVGYSDDEWLQVKAGAMQAATAVPNTTTVNGKRLNNNIVIGMADIPGLLQAIANAGSGAVSVTTNQDGTFVIHVGETDYTINLNHTHEGMAKLIVCEESDLPSTLDPATIYAQVDDAADPTEIQSLWIAGLEFVGGGGAADDTPKLTSPRNGATIDFDGQSTVTIVVKGRNLTSNLSVVATGDFTVTANGQSVSTITAADVTDGASVSLLLTKGNDFVGGTIVISSADLDEDVEVRIIDSSAVVQLTGVKFTGTQWLETDYKANPKTEFILKCRLETNSITNVIDNVNRKNWILGGNDAQGCYEFYHISNSGSGGSNPPYNLMCSLNSLSGGTMIASNSTNMLTDPLIIQYNKTTGKLTAGNASTSVIAKTGSNTGNLRICCRLTNGEDICYSRFYMTIYEFSIIEDGVNVRHYIPMRRFGSPGLYDTVTGSFLTSKTNDPLVEVNS